MSQGMRLKRFLSRIIRWRPLSLAQLLILLFTAGLTFIVVWNTEMPIPYISYDTDDMDSKRDWVFNRGCVDTQEYLQRKDYHKRNATFVILTRNEELDDMLKTIYSIESRFNQWFEYPYVFLNNEPFTEHFQNTIKENTNAKVEFGVIDESMWEFPENIRNSPAFENFLQNQGDRGILYGNQESYHKMCRFYSGFFYRHPLVAKYKWYWRLEPDVEFYCDLTYDPFFEMEKTNKKYAFTIMIPELYYTIPNLFRYTKLFIRQNKLKTGSLWKLFVDNYEIIDSKKYGEYDDFINHKDDISVKLPQEVAIDYLLNEDKNDSDGLRNLINKAKSITPLQEEKFDNEGYNLCHFWSNFEIARVDLYTNEVYEEYFQFLEESNGFWQERWGDAPIHSLGLSLILNFDEVHYFRDIGYRHGEIKHCPKNFVSDDENRSSQLPYQSKHAKYNRGFFHRYDKGHSNGNGCRCSCPPSFDVEDTAYYCMYKWFEMSFANPDTNLGDNTLPGNEHKPLEDVKDTYEEIASQFYASKGKKPPKDVGSKFHKPKVN
ncbi:hypothetical protein TPHA_0G00800 [Tetrapisispora phaffii CBS 4417]|uniref:Mannosyltransferase n=1 Tax=Tetrapisispora phaffii (strain ATCC 24235 / CBS 4417 / NBRC 1672 / NRRL Y-8282 / UCD 70-5) TaxID=1071381 RepID=G8BVI8_TETPH|nr:hypothetical protein TPHA_0G00800 [Tetrapisispora phaffii CBS 4417]CCE63916.1 hypothetical protein TPHA_0G00800 [Tetrapisispora phaffii CBS 4417]